MHELNLSHLRYFWAVVREGSQTKAAARLRVSVPTVSEQLSTLESTLGEPLFSKRGQDMTLSEIGRLVFDHAERIFGMSRDLSDALEQRRKQGKSRLVVGVSEAVPKLVARALIEPALKSKTPVHLVCRQEKQERLLLDLSAFEIDVVLSDQPARQSDPLRAFSHLLGDCGISFVAPPGVAKRYRSGFPESLAGAAMYVPTSSAALRWELDAWFDSVNVRPNITAEFEDTAMLKAFGRYGQAVFPVQSAIEKQVVEEYGVKVVGRCASVRQRFYAITVRRRVQHPAVVALCEAARSDIFAGH